MTFAFLLIRNGLVWMQEQAHLLAQQSIRKLIYRLYIWHCSAVEKRVELIF